MNNFKAGALNSIRVHLETYSLCSIPLPPKIDGTSSGYQCKCKMTNKDHFTVYHSGELDKPNENGLEIAFCSSNISESLAKPDSAITNWLHRISNVLPNARKKTSWQYPRVGVTEKKHIQYLISQLDFLYGIRELQARTFSLKANRPEQAAFRASLLSAYEGTCMITGCNDIEVLEACHIVPESTGGKYTLDNGLLLRADLHKLFDEGLMSINPQSGEVHFSKMLNSKEYRDMANKKLQINLPENNEDWPDFTKIAEHYHLYFSK